MLEPPQNKVNVEFQPSKKMKKRRELDALVCNGKVRRKSKSGHELLRSESESSEIDEFSIAAQKTLFRNRGKSSCSSCKTVLGFLLLGVCLIVCAGLIWLHFDMKNNIQILKDKIHTVEAKNTDSSIEIGAFKKQIDDLKKLVGNSDTKDSTKFTDLNKKVEDLKKSTETLKSAMSVTSKQELDKKLEQLTQIPVISQTVAKIGSDVENLKSKIEELNTFKQDTSKKIEELNEKTGQSGDRESKPLTTEDLFKKYDQLQQTIGDLNLTVLTKVNSLESLFSVNQIKFNQMENQTAQLQDQMSKGTQLHPSSTGLVMTDDIQKQIQDKVEQSVKLMLANKTEGTSDSSLDSILSNIDNVTSMVRDLKDQFLQLKTDHSDMLQPGKSGDNSDLTEFKSTATERLETLNKTMGRLSHDVSVLMHRFILNQNSLTSLTKFVEGIRNYIVILENKIGVPDNKTLHDDAELAKIIQAENVSIPLDNEKNTPESTVAPITTTPRPLIHMKLIHSAEELELGLHRWDKNGDGVLDSDEIESLQDYMPDPPSPEEVKKFDFDGNGTLDIDELKIALGYSPYPSETERQRLADLG